MQHQVSYELDKLESMKHHTPLYRMRAEESIIFNDAIQVQAGEMGGLVEHQYSIDNSWAENGVIVVGEAKIKNCLLRGNTFIAGNVQINGNGYYIGGNSGDVTINGDIKINLECPVDMGPISLTGDAYLTGNGDIMSISGLFKNKGYGTHLTAYKTNGTIYCYAPGLGLCRLLHLPLKLRELEAGEDKDLHIFEEKDDTHLIAFSKHLASFIRSYFK